MKKYLIALALLPLVAAIPAHAQQEQQQAMQQAMAPLPNDPAVRVGHLDNGLTY
jgi:hypothetical protein